MNEASNPHPADTNHAGERAQDPFAVLEIRYHWLDDGGALLAQCARYAPKLGKPRAAYRVAEEAGRMVHGAQ